MSLKLLRMAAFIKAPSQKLVLLNSDLNSVGNDLESKDEVSLKDQDPKRLLNPICATLSMHDLCEPQG